MGTVHFVNQKALLNEGSVEVYSVFEGWRKCTATHSVVIIYFIIPNQWRTVLKLYLFNIVHFRPENV